MSGPDSSPNFAWLKPGAGKEGAETGGNKTSQPLPDLKSFGAEAAIPVEKEQPAEILQEDDIPENSSAAISHETVEVPPEESFVEEAVFEEATLEESIPEDAFHEQLETESENNSLMEDLPAVPDPVMNDSDGTTVIIPNRKFVPAPFSHEKVLPEQFVPPLFPAKPPVQQAPKKFPSFPAFEPSALEEEAVHTAEDAAESLPLEQTEAVPATEEEPDASVSEIAQLIEEEQSKTTIFKSASATESETDSQPEYPGEGPTVLDESSASIPIDPAHTEVLNAEDLVKAQETPWPAFSTVSSEPIRSASTLDPTDFTLSAPLKPTKKIPGEPASTQAPPTAASPSRMFVILASYASAITIAFLALLLRQAYENGHPHQLESLPDIATQKENELTYVPANARLPAGHTLHFGEKQQFGNILVEPLSIVREPVEFVHYTGDKSRQHPNTQPVWKLKVRLTNVSKDQAIAPLDRRLVLRWVSKKGQPAEFTNYFIAEQGTTNRKAPTVQLYRLPVDSDWDLVGQDLGKKLQPGESYETYLASAEEGFDSLPEDLVWRVQIRKGYSPKGNGVTTIFQVAFKKVEVTGA